MFNIDDDNNITLTRGDTATIYLTVVDSEGDEYDFSDDLVQLTVKRNTVTEDIIFQKTFNSAAITIEPADTKHLTYTDLKYDVQIITGNNAVYTVIPPRLFTISEEVNFNVSGT